MRKTAKEGISRTIEIGKKTLIAKDATIDVTGKVKIQSHVQIYEGVTIFTHKHYWNHSRGIRMEIEKIVPVDLTICRDAFIGKNAIIMAINRIGEGAVIGAGAVVTKDVPDFEVWAGNPAECVGVRKEE